MKRRTFVELGARRYQSGVTLRDSIPAKLGVIEQGGYADLLLINGDPLKDISILTKPKENLPLIMKNGKIYKNTTN